MDIHSPERIISVTAGRIELEGSLVIPPRARGVVLFAHGSGSSRHSNRNRLVAQVLQEAAFATLLMDLLTSDEERVDAVTRHLRFDIPLLAERLSGAIDWLTRREETRLLPLGLFGASTGAAAALLAAAAQPYEVQAVVSRGGRPDLAGSALPLVMAPTLLIVGGNDDAVIEFNQRAMRELRAQKELVVVPGASHLFEEPGALEQVAMLSSAWFNHFLVRDKGTAEPSHAGRPLETDAHP
jgi:dienelactone hydrolase